MPFAFTPAQTTDAERGNEFSQMIARLRPGATVAQLNAQMSVAATAVFDVVSAIPACCPPLR